MTETLRVMGCLSSARMSIDEHRVNGLVRLIVLVVLIGMAVFFLLALISAF